MSKRLFTSESVTNGHPDKICDQISDAILDYCLKFDPYSRVACEVMCSTDLVVIAGEISTNAPANFEAIARDVIRKIGYTEEGTGFDYHTARVIVNIDKQSSDIACGVNDSLETRDNKDEAPSTGAGDQGMMFGYATDETEEYLPYPIAFANRLSRRLTEVREQGILPYLRPDGKTQVTVEYNEDDSIKNIDTIVISTQHTDGIELEQIRQDILREVIENCGIDAYIDWRTFRFYINPSGRFVLGGPAADVGLTGRKIIVDTYGGYARHGGGCFSGKDATKVDRSAAYAARYIAKNIVAAGLAKKCEIQLSYAIGMAHPISVRVDTFGTAVIKESDIVDLIVKHFDLTPDGIIKMLDLRKPIYEQTASYGHFGRLDLDLPWERLDKVDLLKSYR